MPHVCDGGVENSSVTRVTADIFGAARASRSRSSTPARCARDSSESVVSMDKLRDRLHSLRKKVGEVGTRLGDVGTRFSPPSEERRSSFTRLASEPLMDTHMRVPSTVAAPTGLGAWQAPPRVTSQWPNAVRPVSSREAYAGIAAAGARPASMHDVSDGPRGGRQSDSSRTTTDEAVQEAVALGLALLDLPPEERDILLVDELAAIAAATRRAVLSGASTSTVSDAKLAASVEALDVLDTVVDQLRHQLSAQPAGEQVVAPPPGTPQLRRQLPVLDVPLIDL